MRHTHSVNDNHPYISDDAAYKEVLEVLTESNDPAFVHLVTMQNHTLFSSKYDDTDFNAGGTSRPNATNAYLQDLYNSDLALEHFINEINEFNEETIVVFGEITYPL